MILRRAFVAEAEVLAAIHAEAFAPGERWGAAAIAMMLEGAGGFGLMGLSGDGPFGEEPLGFALGRAVAGEAEILTLAVRPAARRAGIGRALLRGLVEAARERHCDVLFLEVALSNTAARGLYCGEGAVEAGRRRGYYPDGGDALVLRITISYE